MAKKWLVSSIAVCLYFAIILPIMAYLYVPISAAQPSREQNAEIDPNLPYVPNFDLQSKDLWDDESASFNDDVLKQLLENLTGTRNPSQQDIKDSADGTLTAADFRDNCGEDLNLKVGGLNWSPVYLSTSDYNGGDVILTVLLNDDNSIDSHNHSAVYSYYNIRNENVSVKYPTNMYGTSYIRSEYLNVGTPYVVKNDVLRYNSQSLDNAFALFTMPQFGLTDYIVTPEYVSWQKSGQSTKNILGMSYDLQNENWGVEETDASSNEYNYSHKTHYGDWKNDYIWLPSLCETGYADHYGIWQLSNGQIQIDENSLMGWKGHSSYSILRSAYGRDGLTFTVLGNTDYYAGRYVDMAVLNENGRPAMHLNLTKIMTELNMK